MSTRERLKKPQSISVQRKMKKEATRTQAIQRDLATSHHLTPGDVVQLQRVIGNRAVSQLVQRGGTQDEGEAQGIPASSRRLFVGNLSFSTNTESLRHTFEAAGQVLDVRIITDQGTGQSRGFGFVEMASEQSALQAAQLLDGHTLDGRQIRVQVAPHRMWGRMGHGSGGGGKGGTDVDTGDNQGGDSPT